MAIARGGETIFSLSVHLLHGSLPLASAGARRGVNIACQENPAMEYKAYAREGVAETGSATKRRKQHARSQKRKQEPRVVSLESGTLSFTADEAAELDLCLTKPQKTPEGLLRGARLLLKLYQRG
jgi:hypothetical protein